MSLPKVRIRNKIRYGKYKSQRCLEGGKSCVPNPVWSGDGLTEPEKRVAALVAVMQGLVAATRVSKAQFHVEGGAVTHHHEGRSHHEVLTGLLSRHAYAMVTKLSKFLSNFQNFTYDRSLFEFHLFTAKRNNKYFGKLCDPPCLL